MSALRWVLAKAEIQRLREEQDRIATVIAYSGVGIERKDRSLHDWLAQVLQVLVLGKSNAEDALALYKTGRLR